MPTARPLIVRWVLLLAVIAGVFGMHVLAPGDGPGHGMLPAAMAADQHTHSAMPEPTAIEPAPVGSSTAESPAGTAHGDMAGCILFLVVGGAALLLLAWTGLSSGSGDGDRRPSGRRFDRRRRGPPDGWPRLALNVIRV